MINLSFPEAAPIISELDSRMAKLRPDPIYFYPYLKRVLTTRFEELKPQYPQTIKIPKETKYLLKGDFEPEQTIILNEPVRMEDGTPMWFDTSESQLYLRFGYTNCDARYISSIKLDMEFIRATCSATNS